MGGPYKGKAKGPPFAMLRRDVMEHENYIALSDKAKLLLNEFLYQYRGKNNGDLCCAFSVLRPRGWRSDKTVRNACKELVEAGFVLRTRKGGRHKPNLYAVTMYGIDECNGKVEDVKPSVVAKNTWKMPKVAA